MKLQGVGADTIKCVNFIYLAPVKRETGERPVRTRHCNCGAFYLKHSRARTSLLDRCGAYLCGFSCDVKYNSWCYVIIPLHVCRCAERTSVFCIYYCIIFNIYKTDLFTVINLREGHKTCRCRSQETCLIAVP